MPPSTEHRNRALRTGLTLAALYLLVSTAWIVGTDWLVAEFATDYESLQQMQSIKGLLFIAVMSILTGVFAYHLSLSHESEALSRSQALTDMVTGLPNQLCFRQAMAERLAASSDGQLLLIDAMDFARINASLGRDAGDLLLFSVAQRIRRCLDSGQLLFRLQSDKFAIISPPGNPVAVRESSEKLLAAIARPFKLGKSQITLDFAIGIVALDHAHDRQLSRLIDAAELALSEAKNSPPPRCVFFSESMRTERSREFALESELRNAIEKRNLSIHVQPQFESISGESRRGEVLVRWEHPERGFISPALFIPVAEKAGLIEQVSEVVMEKTLDLLASMRDSGRSNMTLSINAAGHQLDSGKLIDTLVSASQQMSIPLTMLEIEITESMALRNPDNAIHFLGRLRELGATVALDDFGTGYSSLQYLLELPIDVLKIDRSFVRDMEADPKKHRFIRTIIELASDLGMLTVAEGVETSSQMKMLQELGCDYLQGFLLSRPLPPEEFIAVLDSIEKEKLSAFG